MYPLLPKIKNTSPFTAFIVFSKIKGNSTALFVLKIVNESKFRQHLHRGVQSFICEFAVVYFLTNFIHPWSGCHGFLKEDPGGRVVKVAARAADPAPEYEVKPSQPFGSLLAKWKVDPSPTSPKHSPQSMQVEWPRRLVANCHTSLSWRRGGGGRLCLRRCLHWPPQGPYVLYTVSTASCR